MNLFERTIYNDNLEYFRIGGVFKRDGDWFVFNSDFKNILFKTISENDFKMSDVNRFRIYILGDDNKKLPLRTSNTFKIGKIYNKIQNDELKNGYVENPDKIIKMEVVQ